MSDIHIDDFYKDAARILVTLYNNFPRKIILYVEDISGPDTPDEFGLHSPRHDACLHTMLWLASTGYLHYGQIVHQEAVDEAWLSHKAFTLLNSPVPGESPEDDGETPPPLVGLDNLFVNRLRKELHAGTSFTLAELMKQLLSTSRQFS